MYECFSNENLMVEITLRNHVVGSIFKASAIYPIATGLLEYTELFSMGDP